MLVLTDAEGKSPDKYAEDGFCLCSASKHILVAGLFSFSDDVWEMRCVNRDGLVWVHTRNPRISHSRCVSGTLTGMDPLRSFVSPASSSSFFFPRRRFSFICFFLSSLQTMPPPTTTTTTGSRSLALHVSALNDSEYDYFTTSFSDLLDDPDAFPSDDSRYEQATISTRETRAWLRGRYPSVALPELNTILRTITPNGSDVLTGGQFFTVMRLITHVAAGGELDGNLVFTQCEFSPLFFVFHSSLLSSIVPNSLSSCGHFVKPSYAFSPYV